VVASRRRTPSGAQRKLVGVASVIDQDTASELLAREPHADPFVI
jgi:carbamate kinase